MPQKPGASIRLGVPRDTTPPHDLEAEQAVLGSILMKGDIVNKVTGMVRGEDFYLKAHQQIYDSILDLFERSEPVDLIIATNRLKERGHLEEVGGAAYVTSLLDAVPTAANIDSYARIVRDCSAKRALIDMAAEVGHATEGGHDAKGLLTLVEQMVGTIRQRIERDSCTDREGARTNRISGAALAGDTVSPQVVWTPLLGLDGVVGPGITTLLSSHGKTGKTTFLLHAIRAMSAMKVVWISEEPRSLWRTRVLRFPELASPDLTLVFASGRAWPDLMADLNREAADVIIVDTIRAVCGILDENDQAAVTAAIQPLVFLARRKNWALVLLHHLRKSAADVGLGHAGSHALVGLVDVAVELHRDSHSAKRRFCRAVSRFEETPTEWLLELNDGHLHALGDPRVVRAAEVVDRVATILEAQGQTRKEIAGFLEPRPSDGALQSALRALVQSGRAVRTGEGKRGDPHRWKKVNESIHSRNPSNT